MGKITILPETTKAPITLIGRSAGECWGADTTDDKKNFNRGMECLEIPHGRAIEFPDIYMVLDGYSARVIREWYTHVGGAPTRLQASTRYINYENFPYVAPGKITSNQLANKMYSDMMRDIADTCASLEMMGMPREDAAMLLPLGMMTKIVDKRNLRNLIDMSRQRMCARAYWEFRQLFNDIITALKKYSPQWEQVCGKFLMPKCKALGYCPEKYSCGSMPKKEVFDYYMAHAEEIRKIIEQKQEEPGD